MTPESPQHWACGRTQLLSIKRARSEPHVFGFPTIFPSWRIPRTQSHGRTCLQHIQLEVQLQTTRCSHFPVSRSQLLVGRQLPAPAGSMRVGYSPGEMISCIPPPHLREVLKGSWGRGSNHDNKFKEFSSSHALQIPPASHLAEPKQI